MPPTKVIRFDIGGMTGPEDADRVRRAISRHGGVVSVDCDLVTELATVEVTSSSSLDALTLGIEESVAAAGYEASLRDSADEPGLEVLTERSRLAGRNALIAAALAAVAVGLSLVSTRGVLGWLELAVSIAALAVPGRALVTAAVEQLRRPGLPALAVLAASSAIAGAAASLILGGASSLADAGAAIVAFALAGRWLEDRAHRGSGAAISGLERADPARARRLRVDATRVAVSEMVGVGELAPGDLVRVAAGEAIPVDGVVKQGSATVDESLVSPAEAPVTRAAGDAVVAGTVVTDGTVIVEVRRTGREAVVARLRAAVAEARGTRTPISLLAERVAIWIVPAALLLALAALAVRAWVLGHPLSAALPAAVAVLAGACPPALLLATPIALAISTARAARRGILFRNAEALERAHGVTTVAIDKAGTLTAGRPVVERHEAVSGGDATRVLALAAAAERAVDSPLSRAVRSYAERRAVLAPPLDRGVYTAGMGVTAVVAGTPVIVGSRRHLERENVPTGGADELERRVGGSGRSLLFVAIEGRLSGALAVHDPVRADAPATVSRLRGAGWRVVLLSGDGLSASDAAAKEASVDEVIANLRPDEKRHALATLRKQHGPVAAVGDGVDDAPVLAAADVGIALGRGADLALEAGSITVLHGDLAGVGLALGIARRAVSIMRQNLVGAALANGAAMAAAAFLPLGPRAPLVTAAIAALSTAFVVVNALRLRRAMI